MRGRRRPPRGAGKRGRFVSSGRDRIAERLGCFVALMLASFVLGSAGAIAWAYFVNGR